MRPRLRQRGIELMAPYRRTIGIGATKMGVNCGYKRRWIVEGTNSWLGQFRRLLVRHEQSALHLSRFLLHCLLLDYAETLFMKYALASCGFAALTCVQYPGDLGQQRAQGEWFFQQFGIMMKDAVIVDQIVVVA